MILLKISNLIQHDGHVDYKGLNLDKIKPGSQLYPDYSNVAYLEYDGEIDGLSDVQVVTQATYDEHKQRIANQPRPITPEEKIQQLEEQNMSLMLAIAELADANEQDKIETQLAIAELATIVTGGVA